MNNTTLVSLFSSLSLVGLFVVSCSSTPRPFDDGVGRGGEGDVADSGRTSTAGRGGASAGDGGASTAGGGGAGAMLSAGANSVSMGGDNTQGRSGAAGSGESGGQGVPECTANQKLCGGLCVDINDPIYGCDPTLCTTTGCPDAPGGTLVCNAGHCLLGSCGSGTKKCDDRCVSLTDPAYGCGPATCDASTCPAIGTGASLTCEGSACVVGACPTGYKKCSNKCVAVSDPTYGCGATSCDATSCPAAGTATLVCQNSSCVIGSCGAGTKKCGSNCVTTDANHGCADAANCTACANNEACSGTPTTCQCVPTPMAAACAGKCGSVSNGCGGMYTCPTCGGSTPSCVSNKCVCTPTPMATACSGKSCGTVSDGCTGTYTCGATGAPCSDGNACTDNDSCQSNGSCGGSYAPITTGCGNSKFCDGNGACKCRTKSPGNKLLNPGFDGSTNSWTLNGASYSTSPVVDVENCSGSGSVLITGLSNASQCVDALPNTIYYYGFRFKSSQGPTAGGTAFCNVSFLSGGCSGSSTDSVTVSVQFSDDSWIQAFANAASPATTDHMNIVCTAAGGGNGYYDQIYINPTTGSY